MIELLITILVLLLIIVVLIMFPKKIKEFIEGRS